MVREDAMQLLAVELDPVGSTCMGRYHCVGDAVGKAVSQPCSLAGGGAVMPTGCIILGPSDVLAALFGIRVAGLCLSPRFVVL